MGTSMRWTIADLEAFPEPLDDTRYEIIDGQLYVSTQPSLEHQYASGVIHAGLREWSDATGRGLAFIAPGVIFAADDNVAPDVVWLSRERLREVRGADGKLHGAPELMVEVLSPGGRNELRDREAKLKLYSRRGVDEYWLLDWQQRRAEAYRRAPDGPELLTLAAALSAADRLESPLVPGFGVQVGRLFLADEI
jgi:Uma2 family endonuclease